VARDPQRPDHGPRPIDASLEAVSEKLGIADGHGVGRLFARWTQIVGPALAEHVQPVRLDHQVLVVVVEHPAWATQVRRLGDALLDRVADECDVPRPTRVEVRVQR
jgi:predicted nucleic acid-binding Zn ribbon protein